MPKQGLTPPYAVEVVYYKLNDDVDPDEFLALSRQVETDFTSLQPGFLDRDIGISDDGTWMSLVYWKSQEDARNSIANIETIPETVQKYMTMINRDTLTRANFTIR